MDKEDICELIQRELGISDQALVETHYKLYDSGICSIYEYLDFAKKHRDGVVEYVRTTALQYRELLPKRSRNVLSDLTLVLGIEEAYAYMRGYAGVTDCEKVLYKCYESSPDTATPWQAVNDRLYEVIRKMDTADCNAYYLRVAYYFAGYYCYNKEIIDKYYNTADASTRIGDVNLWFDACVRPYVDKRDLLTDKSWLAMEKSRRKDEVRHFVMRERSYSEDKMSEAIDRIPDYAYTDFAFSMAEGGWVGWYFEPRYHEWCDFKDTPMDEAVKLSGMSKQKIGMLKRKYPDGTRYADAVRWELQKLNSAECAKHDMEVYKSYQRFLEKCARDYGIRDRDKIDDVGEGIAQMSTPELYKLYCEWDVCYMLLDDYMRCGLNERNQG